MFNFSGSEIVFLLLLALIVLGPEKLPEAVRKFGKTYGEFKKMTTGFQSELKSALDEPMREMRETADAFKKAASFEFDTPDDAADETAAEPSPETKPKDVTPAPAPEPALEPASEAPAADDASTAQEPVATGLDAVVVRDAPVARGSTKATPAAANTSNTANTVNTSQDAPADSPNGDQGAASA